MVRKSRDLIDEDEQKWSRLFDGYDVQEALETLFEQLVADTGPGLAERLLAASLGLGQRDSRTLAAFGKVGVQRGGNGLLDVAQHELHHGQIGKLSRVSGERPFPPAGFR